MKITRSTRQLILQDSPGLHWILGALFLAVGGLFVAGPLGLFENSDDLSPLMKLSVIAMGCCAVGVGGWVIYQSPLTAIVFDRVQGQLVEKRRGLLGGSTTRCRLADISTVCVVKDRDDEGDPIYRVAVSLRSGEVVPLS